MYVKKYRLLVVTNPLYFLIYFGFLFFFSFFFQPFVLQIIIKLKETVSTVTTNCSTTSDLWGEVFTEKCQHPLFNCPEIKIPYEKLFEPDNIRTKVIL